MKDSLNCPCCQSNTKIEYLGFSFYHEILFQLFECTNYKQHADRKKIYFTRTRWGENIIEEVSYDIFNSIKDYRIKCPKHNEHDRFFDKDHEYKYLIAVSHKALDKEELRFYCKNHLKKTHQDHARYHFIYNNEKIQVTLQDLLKKIDKELYISLNKIYKEKIKYDLKKDKEGLLYKLLAIGLSTNIIAKMFHTNQSKISRLKKKFDSDNQIIKVNTIKNDLKGRLFYTKINLQKNIDVEYLF